MPSLRNFRALKSCKAFYSNEWSDRIGPAVSCLDCCMCVLTCAGGTKQCNT